MSTRSQISDLNSLVNEAKSVRTTGSGGSGGSRGSRGSNNNSGGGGGGRSIQGSIASTSRGHPPPNPFNSSMANDDASISSFSRNVARVARAAEGKDGMMSSVGGGSSVAGSVNSRRSGVSGGGSSRGGGRGGMIPLPPPRGAGADANPYVRNNNNGSQASIASSTRSRASSSSSRRSGRSSAGSSSRQSNATTRLMNLVNELSQPRGAPSDPSVASSVSGGGGYLPSQYSYGGGGSANRASNRSNSRNSRGGGGSSRGSGGSSTGGSSNYSRSSRGGNSSSGSISARSSTSSIPASGSILSNSLEPTGFIMPPGGAPSVGGGQSTAYDGSSHINSNAGSNSMYGDPRGVPAAIANNSAVNNSYSRQNSDSMMSGSIAMTSTTGQTSVGQSTMPTEYPGYGMGVPIMGGNGSVTQDSFNSHPSRVVVDPSIGRPGGSMASSSRMSNTMNEDPSIMSGSFASQPSYNNRSQMGGGSHMMQGGSIMSNNNTPSHISGASNPSHYTPVHNNNGYQMGPYMGNMGGTDMSLVSSSTSRNSRSIANSGALIPKAKFSWASESLGTQSTVLTRRSIASASVPEPQQQREGGKVVEGRLWASFAWIITFPLPNKCIMRPTKDAKQAWREKVALFLIMVSCSVFFVGVFGFVPLLLCKEDTIFSMQDIWLQTGENWVVVHGTIYDVKDLIYRHPGGVKGIVDFLGKDGSKVFPRAPPVTLPQKCLDMEKVKGFNLDVYSPDNNFTNPTCASFSDLDILLGITCHTFAAGSNGTAKFLGDYERGVLSHTTVGLNDLGIQWIGLYDRVYDVTTYIKRINENREPTLDGEDSLENNPAAYLTPTLNTVIMNSLGGDATDLYEALFGSSEYIACLEEMFYIGLLDDEFDTFCYTLNIMMYCMLVFVATLMVIQFIASMIYICPRHRTYSEEDVMSPVMIMVPCYNEGDNELRKTIKSVLNTMYPDENKVLFMVADGIVTGNGEDMSTPEHLANILGFDIDEFEDDTFEYDCIGVIHTKNRARVYHGILQKGHKFLKYIAVVKCGLPEEATTSAKPGNRGKRDSQLVIMGYYNRIHYGRELTELDSAIQRAMVDLNLQADMVRFLMAIDADTRVDTMSITHMVYGMDKKEKVLALCGETKVDNKASSWVTMIQVFEYYNSHHLKKAFEAAFGCVTCLPGCFTMYRIIADDGTPLLPGDGVLYEYSRNDVETLHEKNLYHLGEDRMLTTLLLKYYPDRSLTFIPEATCWTIVPHTFRILLSQRRRWINSTVHNMFELLKVNTMCGVCCVSMKVVVFIDLIATMILPASYVYAMYLLFLVFFEDLPVSTVLLILYAIIMGVQVVVFILRSRWEYLWWFLIYFTIGLPVFYLVLPTYSFWNMDDFSWGKTRAVGGSAAQNAVPEEEDEDEDDDSDDDDDESEHKSLKRGYNDNTDETVPSAMPDGRSIASSSSGDSSSEESDDESSYDSRSEYSDSQAESEYFSQASKMQRSAP